jgi:hypothetical protein
MLGDGALGGVKISDNESPLPADRVFLYYSLSSSGVSSVHRETVGFEKTFLDGQASIGLRLPFVETVFPGGSTTGLGDVSFLAKYALLNDPATGNLLSTGIVVSVPTSGTSIEVQPYIGWIWHPAVDTPFYLNGFSGLSIPLPAPAGAYITNDIGAGFRYTDLSTSLVTAIVPTAEIHINTPVSSIGLTNINLGVGGHIELSNGALLGAALNIPIAGPKPYDIQAVLNFNLKY